MASCAALGPNDGYLFNSPNQWSWANLDPRLDSLFTKPTGVKEVYEIALGPDGSFYIAYKDATGQNMLWHVGLPEGLRKWLKPDPDKCVPHDLTSLQVILGPNKSYFAIAGNGATCWGNLPSALNEAIEQYRKPGGGWKPGWRPQSVALGPDGAYVMTTDGGGGNWDLKDKYPALNKYLRDANSLKGVSVILSPCSSDIHLIITHYGAYSYCLPNSQHKAYEAFRDDWKASVKKTRARQRQQQQRTSMQVAKTVGFGLKLLNTVMSAANGYSGGGGGTTYVNENVYVDNSSSFWDPIIAAANFN